MSKKPKLPSDMDYKPTCPYCDKPFKIVSLPRDKSEPRFNWKSFCAHISRCKLNPDKSEQKDWEQLGLAYLKFVVLRRMPYNPAINYPFTYPEKFKNPNQSLLVLQGVEAKRSNSAKQDSRDAIEKLDEILRYRGQNHKSNDITNHKRPRIINLVLKYEVDYDNTAERRLLEDHIKKKLKEIEERDIVDNISLNHIERGCTKITLKIELHSGNIDLEQMAEQMAKYLAYKDKTPKILREHCSSLVEEKGSLNVKVNQSGQQQDNHTSARSDLDDTAASAEESILSSDESSDDDSFQDSVDSKVTTAAKCSENWAALNMERLREKGISEEDCRTFDRASDLSMADIECSKVQDAVLLLQRRIPLDPIASIKVAKAVHEKRWFKQKTLSYNNNLIIERIAQALREEKRHTIFAKFTCRMGKLIAMGLVASILPKLRETIYKPHEKWGLSNYDPRKRFRTPILIIIKPISKVVGTVRELNEGWMFGQRLAQDCSYFQDKVALAIHKPTEGLLRDNFDSKDDYLFHVITQASFTMTEDYEDEFFSGYNTIIIDEVDDLCASNGDTATMKRLQRLRENEEKCGFQPFMLLLFSFTDEKKTIEKDFLGKKYISLENAKMVTNKLSEPFMLDIMSRQARISRYDNTCDRFNEGFGYKEIKGLTFAEYRWAPSGHGAKMDKFAKDFIITKGNLPKGFSLDGDADHNCRKHIYENWLDEHATNTKNGLYNVDSPSAVVFIPNHDKSIPTDAMYLKPKDECYRNCTDSSREIPKQDWIAKRIESLCDILMHTVKKGFYPVMQVQNPFRPSNPLHSLLSFCPDPDAKAKRWKDIVIKIMRGKKERRLTAAKVKKIFEDKIEEASSGEIKDLKENFIFQREFDSERSMLLTGLLDEDKTLKGKEWVLKLTDNHTVEANNKLRELASCMVDTLERLEKDNKDDGSDYCRLNKSLFMPLKKLEKKLKRKSQSKEADDFEELLNRNAKKYKFVIFCKQKHRRGSSFPSACSVLFLVKNMNRCDIDQSCMRPTSGDRRKPKQYFQITVLSKEVYTRIRNLFFGTGKGEGFYPAHELTCDIKHQICYLTSQVQSMNERCRKIWKNYKEAKMSDPNLNYPNDLDTQSKEAEKFLKDLNKEIDELKKKLQTQRTHEKDVTKRSINMLEDVRDQDLSSGEKKIEGEGISERKKEKCNLKECVERIIALRDAERVAGEAKEHIEKDRDAILQDRKRFEEARIRMEQCIQKKNLSIPSFDCLSRYFLALIWERYNYLLQDCFFNRLKNLGDIRIMDRLSELKNLEDELKESTVLFYSARLVRVDDLEDCHHHKCPPTFMELQNQRISSKDIRTCCIQQIHHLGVKMLDITGSVHKSLRDYDSLRDPNLKMTFIERIFQRERGSKDLWPLWHQNWINEQIQCICSKLKQEAEETMNSIHDSFPLACEKVGNGLGNSNERNETSIQAYKHFTALSFENQDALMKGKDQILQKRTHHSEIHQLKMLDESKSTKDAVYRCFRLLDGLYQMTSSAEFTINFDGDCDNLKPINTWIGQDLKRLIAKERDLGESKFEFFIEEFGGESRDGVQPEQKVFIEKSVREQTSLLVERPLKRLLVYVTEPQMMPINASHASIDLAEEHNSTNGEMDLDEEDVHEDHTSDSVTSEDNSTGSDIDIPYYIELNCINQQRKPFKIPVDSKEIGFKMFQYLLSKWQTSEGLPGRYEIVEPCPVIKAYERLEVLFHDDNEPKKNELYRIVDLNQEEEEECEDLREGRWYHLDELSKRGLYHLIDVDGSKTCNLEDSMAYISDRKKTLLSVKVLEIAKDVIPLGAKIYRKVPTFIVSFSEEEKILQVEKENAIVEDLITRFFEGNDEVDNHYMCLVKGNNVRRLEEDDPLWKIESEIRRTKSQLRLFEEQRNAVLVLGNDHYETLLTKPRQAIAKLKQNAIEKLYEGSKELFTLVGGDNQRIEDSWTLERVKREYPNISYFILKKLKKSNIDVIFSYRRLLKSVVYGSTFHLQARLESKRTDVEKWVIENTKNDQKYALNLNLSLVDGSTKHPIDWKDTILQCCRRCVKSSSSKLEFAIECKGLASFRLCSVTKTKRVRGVGKNKDAIFREPDVNLSEGHRACQYFHELNIKYLHNMDMFVQMVNITLLNDHHKTEEQENAWNKFLASLNEQMSNLVPNTPFPVQFDLESKEDERFICELLSKRWEPIGHMEATPSNIRKVYKNQEKEKSKGRDVKKYQYFLSIEGRTAVKVIKLDSSRPIKQRERSENLKGSYIKLVCKKSRLPLDKKTVKDATSYFEVLLSFQTLSLTSGPSLTLGEFKMKKGINRKEVNRMLCHMWENQNQNLISNKHVDGEYSAMAFRLQDPDVGKRDSNKDESKCDSNMDGSLLNAIVNMEKYDPTLFDGLQIISGYILDQNKDFVKPLRDEIRKLSSNDINYLSYNKLVVILRDLLKLSCSFSCLGNCKDCVNLVFVVLQIVLQQLQGKSLKSKLARGYKHKDYLSATEHGIRFKEKFFTAKTRTRSRECSVSLMFQQNVVHNHMKETQETNNTHYIEALRTMQRASFDDEKDGTPILLSRLCEKDPSFANVFTGFGYVFVEYGKLRPHSTSMRLIACDGEQKHKYDILMNKSEQSENRIDAMKGLMIRKGDVLDKIHLKTFQNIVSSNRGLVLATKIRYCIKNEFFPYLSTDSFTCDESFDDDIYRLLWILFSQAMGRRLDYDWKPEDNDWFQILVNPRRIRFKEKLFQYLSDKIQGSDEDYELPPWKKQRTRIQDPHH
eukprot:jgi/Bigna1/77905/fgenesh1_pg.51_\